MNERVLRAIAPYGTGIGLEPGGAPDVLGPARAVIDSLADDAGSAGRVVLVTGSSGAGKSSVLGVVGRALAGGAGTVRADALRIERGVAVAGLAGRTRLGDWLGCLSRAGLADARLFATRAGDLSVGESARLRLALAMARIERAPQDARPVLVCDEFCSVLDRETACGVASALRRWASASGARVVVATAHADMARLLGPDRVVRLSPDGAWMIEDGAGTARGPRVVIERGDGNDYRAVSAHHYRSGRPASVCRVLRAVVSGASGPRVAGVLVVSCPTLNGAWREFAWPGRYVGTRSDRTRCARRLNREVRRISRVIVDPRDRGRGIARRLVRAYLDDPMTPATEAVSAMGRLSPFGRSAGMVEYEMPPRPADDRLGDMLHAMGIEPWELLDAARVACVRGSSAGPWLERELGLWARAVRSSVPKPMRDAPDSFVYASLAAGRLCAPPVAYAHVRS